MKRFMSSVAAQAISSVAMSQDAYAKMVIAITRTYPPTLDPKKAPGFGAGPGIVHAQYAIIDVTTIAVANDLTDLFYLPKGAVPIGGYYSSADLDTGTETLDIDIGIAANGVDSADPDFFMNGGVMTGDAPDDVDTTGAFTNFANVREFRGPFPVTQLGAKTLVQMKCIAAANATGTGKIVVRVDYLMPGNATS